MWPQKMWVQFVQIVAKLSPKDSNFAHIVVSRWQQRKPVYLVMRLFQSSSVFAPIVAHHKINKIAVLISQICNYTGVS